MIAVGMKMPAWVEQGFSEYSRFIYEENDPVFVGEYSNLIEYLDTLQSLNKKQFGTSSIKVSELKDYWEGKEDVTHKLEDLISYTSGESVPTDDFNKRLLMIPARKQLRRRTPEVIPAWKQLRRP